MRTGPPGIGFPCHVHELEIKSLHTKILFHLQTMPESDLKRGYTRDFPIKVLNDFYENYYIHKVSEIDQSGFIVIEAGDADYNIFLTLALSILDPFKIESFLSYHKEKFSGEDFEGVIEYQVYEILEMMIPIENTHRRERIMIWINEERRRNPVRTIVKIPKKSLQEQKYLIWHSDYSISLKKISKRLWMEKFTKRRGDFEKVFTEGKEILWKKDAEHLCYLLYKLRTHNPPLYKSSMGKDHYKLISKYFSDNDRKLAKKNYISDTIYKLKIRNVGKTIPERVSIDDMIERFIK